jgi:hypothetical protein
MSTDPGDIDRLFEVLSHPYRRRLLASLQAVVTSESHRPEIDLATLSESVATDRDPQEVQALLVHCHLPKLDRYGFITWDRETETVTRGPEWAMLEPFVGLFVGKGSTAFDIQI